MSNERKVWEELVEAIRAERAAKDQKEKERLQKESERLAAKAERLRDSKEK